jgi:hypothetical protein
VRSGVGVISCFSTVESCSATLSEIRIFPVGGIVSLFVEDVSEAIQDRVLRAEPCLRPGIN